MDIYHAFSHKHCGHNTEQAGRYCQINSFGPVEICCQESSNGYCPLSKGIYPEFSILLSAYKMSSKVEKIVDRRVDSQKSLSLCCRFDWVKVNLDLLLAAGVLFAGSLQEAAS